MQLIAWHPFFQLQKQSAGYGFQLLISARCSTCRTIIKFNTDPYELPSDPSDTLIREAIHAAVDQAAYPFICKHCGVNQNFSAQEASRFRQETEQRLSVEWLREQVSKNV